MTSPMEKGKLDEQITSAVGERISEVEVEVATIKQAVRGNSTTLARIEQKLEAPSGQPSWVAISGLLATVVGLMAAVILAFVSKTTEPLEKEIAKIESGMAFDNSREESEVARMATLETKVDRLQTDSAATFRYLSRLAGKDLDVLRAREAELERQLERAHSEAHQSHKKKGE